MKNRIFIILFALLTLIFVLSLSVNASTTCAHENKNVTAVEYTDYAQNGKLKFVCANCNEIEKTLKPLVISNGYSISRDGSSLCAGYKINNEAIAEILKLNTKFELGMVAASKSLLGDKMPLDSKTAEAVDLSQYGASVIKASVTDGSFSTVDIRLNGFDSEKYYEQLYLSAFVFDGNSLVL